MIRSSVLFIVLSFAITGCGVDDPNTVTVRLGDDSEAVVYLEEESVDGVRLLVIDYKTDRARQKESEVEDDVKRIWDSARKAAETRGIREALIKYRQPDLDSDEPGAYIGLLFEAEQIENGTWKLKKVN